MIGNAAFENFNCKIASAFINTIGIEIYKIFSLLIPNSRIFRAVVRDKTQHESEERLVSTLPASLPASSRNSLVSCSSGECQTVARDNVTAQK